MKIAPLPKNERSRQKAVESYQLLDTLPDESYDSITNVVAAICNAPIALITLLDNDRNFLKSRHGIKMSESPRDISFCSHAIIGDEDIMIIPDARKDMRFIDNPMIAAQNSIFYAGVPLIDEDGHKLGTLCVFDHEPRDLNDVQKEALKSFAKHVMLLFTEKKKNLELQRIEKELKERNQELKDFAGIITHDLKTPLSHISMISQLLSEENKDTFSETSKEYMVLLENAGFNLSRYIDGMLVFYSSDELIKDELDEVSYIDLLEDIKSIAITDVHSELTYSPTTDITMHTSNAALHQILLNLVTNSVKYGDKKQTKIHVDLVDNEHDYTISVKDNGCGIPKESIDDVFKLFYTVDTEDRNGNKGTGIGLATTKRLLDQLQGTIEIESELGKGTGITIKLPKEFNCNSKK